MRIFSFNEFIEFFFIFFAFEQLNVYIVKMCCLSNSRKHHECPKFGMYFILRMHMASLSNYNNKIP